MKHTEVGRPGRLWMPRSRGALTGSLLVVLGAWGALIPFIGPYFHFAYTPGQQWVWTAVRGWLEVLPGIATVAGGLLLIGSKDRASAMLGGWLAVLGGAWFVVGPAFAPALHIGAVGDPVASTELKRAWLEVSYFTGLGAVIVFLGGAVLARLVARLARDIEPFTPVEPSASEPTPEPRAEAEPSAAAETETEKETETEPEPHHGRRISFRRHRSREPVGHSQ